MRVARTDDVDVFEVTFVKQGFALDFGKDW